MRRAEPGQPAGPELDGPVLLGLCGIGIHQGCGNGALTAASANPSSGRWPPRSPPDPCHLDLWRGNSTAAAAEREALLYSTDTYAAETVGLIEQKQPGVPMFVYLAWQAVHGPWTLPPGPAARLLQPGDHGYTNYCSPDPLPTPDPNPDGLGRVGGLVRV